MTEVRLGAAGEDDDVAFLRQFDTSHVLSPGEVGAGVELPGGGDARLLEAAADEGRTPGDLVMLDPIVADSAVHFHDLRIVGGALELLRAEIGAGDVEGGGHGQ